jgi:AraC-like DNA-binding protein
MKATEKGVSQDSDISFYYPSERAKGLFFYLLCYGHFHCVKGYSVDRMNYDSFLFIYVKSGELEIETDAMQLKARAGQLCLLNCYMPHKYYTNSSCEMLWFHFDGILAEKYYELIRNADELFLAPVNANLIECCFQMFARPETDGVLAYEASVSKYITNLFTELIADSNRKKIDHMDEIIEYISEHLTEDLSVRQLAEMASLSESRFAHVFKNATGHPPHLYIVDNRLNYAKYLLDTTDIPIKEIYLMSGFNSKSYFASAFKNRFDISPYDYRNK